MRIKKLELHGFKSFKDRTVIHFDAGITGIVGPNGCGKSNIVDALVWVMGEMSAKHLRGSSMEDVIFAGAEGYAPVGLAEVSLTLENDGNAFPAKYMHFSEVMVTRRLHRSGESEYLINKEPARLRDIQEIFMDTGAGSKGFSIIEQGAIGKIITAKPEDRRMLIEEAAGITKFKVRKRESQRKLEATEQNLLRLQDIIGEQKRQLDSLERQAQRAERYRGLKNQVQEKEVLLSSKSYLHMHEESAAAEAILNEAREFETSTQSEMGQKEASLQTMKLDLLEKEKAVEEKATAHGHLHAQTQRMENEIRELHFEIEQAKRNKEMTGSILGQFQARKQALDVDLAATLSRHQSVKVEAEESEVKYNEQREKLTAVQERIRVADEELTVKRREMLTVSQSESHLDAKIVALESQIEQHDERVQSSLMVVNELKEQRDGFETRRNSLFSQLEQERQMQLGLMQDAENFHANLEILKTQFSEKTKDLQSFKDSLNEVSSRLYGLENLHANFEGFEEGVKNVMLWQKKKVEHAGGQVEFIDEMRPLAEVVEVPESYELAMEAALGSKLQLLLSEKSETALGAVDYLKEQKTGRSGFISSDISSKHTLSEQQANHLKGAPGVEALLKDVVTIPEKFQKQVEAFVGSVAIVDSVRSALKLRPEFPGVTFVTKDGDALSSDGVLTGGTAESADSGVLKRRREIKELSGLREESAGKLALAQVALKKLESQVETVTKDYENAKKLQSEKELLLTSLRKDLERAENELNNAGVALQRQSAEVDRLQAQLQKMREDQSELQDKITEVRERKLELDTAVQSLTQEVDGARTGIDQLQHEVTGLQVSSASKRQELNGLNHQLEMLNKSLAEIDEQLQRMNSETEKSVESLSVNQILIEQKKVELEHSIREVELAAQAMSQSKDDYEQLSAQVRELESELSKKMMAISEQRSRLNEAQLKLEQLRMKEQYLIDQINERYMLALSEIAHQYKDTEADVPALEAEVQDLKSKLNKIGEVNLSAIEEYDDLINRYNFMSQQFTDLTEAKEQLRRVIDRINRICSRRFKETFEQVNERFTKVFPVLFGGGEAKLTLVEDPDKDEVGIDIMSRPPGKKLQSVTLLSGGEKALTAVSLIFSIFLVKPSPFCLLDEVDAPLDDANVSRFNDLVKEMAKRSQIIVVTHNKHTMKVNNKLFGVTMEEKGVSKMVSVSLADVDSITATA